jgi:hypothetical protein
LRKQERQITLKVQEGKYFENGGAGGIVEASEGGVEEGGVEDCTGSVFSFVVTSGGRLRTRVEVGVGRLARAAARPFSEV